MNGVLTFISVKFSPFIESKDWKTEFPTYCGTFSPNYLATVAKVRGVLETRGDVDEDELGFRQNTDPCQLTPYWPPVDPL